METIYTIDNGNSHPHVGIFKKRSLIEVLPFKDFFFEQENSQIVLSSVGKELNLPYKNILDVKSLRTPTGFLDMKVNYSQTIGMDRLACAYFVYKNHLCPGEKILLIDAGTFTTFDLVTANGLEGGFIFPGLQTFLDSYIKGTQLPSLKLNSCSLTDEIKLPHNTQDAILESLKCYFQMSLKSLLDQYKPDLIITTGGEGKYFSEAFFIPHLIHTALFTIKESYENFT